jgi:bacterioferritin (cytochrome b1)
MLLSRDELRFDFGEARLDPVRDREILGWMCNQFLYGEMTGIQVGQWIYDAPDLEAARFLAKQAIEELQHVQGFLDIMKRLEVRPGKPHGVVRFLATDMMGDDWAEHVAMEMATGEGFVVQAFYALIDTLDAPAIVQILERQARQEEGHIDFGERQTMKLIAGDPALARRLLGLNLVWRWGVQRLAGYVSKRLPREHPVLGQLDAFLAHALDCNELRLRRMGMLDRPLAELSAAERARIVGAAYGQKLGHGALGLLSTPLRMLPFVGRRKRLTDTYLDDPAVRALSEAPDRN